MIVKGKLDLRAAKPYLHALRTAENFPALFLQCERMESPDMNAMMDEAMEEIDRWCPWVWPQLDNAILRIVESRGI